MTTAATSLLGLALPVTGELAGTWGTTVNDSITSLLDTAVAGTTTLSTDADVTLTTTTLAANQARQAILLCSGARTALRTITAPAQSKIYTVINSTTGGYAVKIVGVGPTTGVTIGSGQSAQVAWNGSDFVQVGASAGGSNTQVQYNNNGALAGSANLTFNGTTLTANALTVTNATTLSGGTANGVAYLNGSKVVTTGSALTFDGTNAVSMGSGGSSNTATSLTLNATDNAANGSYILGKRNGSSAWLIGDTASSLGSGSGFTSYNYGTAPWIWYLQTGGEQMRLTSTGLGIGTSSPVDKLEVYSTITARAASGTSALRLRNTTSDYQWQTVAGTNAINLYDNAVGSSRLTVDSSGNLGIGTSSPGYKLDVNGTARFNNTFDFGAGQSITSGSGAYRAAKFGAASGAYNVLFSGSTAFQINDNADTANLLVLTNSGNLGIGTSSPGSKLHLYSALGTTQVTQDAATAYRIIANNGINYIQSGAALSSDSKAPLVFTSMYGVTEWMRIDTSGNLGIGTSSPTVNLHVYNASSAEIRTASANIGLQLYSSEGAGTSVIGTYTNHALVFRTNATERARIDSSGNLLIGTTSSDGSRLRVYGSYQTLGDGSYEGLIGKASSLVSGGGAGEFAIRSSSNLLFATNGNTERARIDSSGNLLVGTTSATGLGVGTAPVQSAGSIFSGGTNAGFAFKDRGASTFSLWYKTGGVNYFYTSGAGANVASINETTGAYTALSDVSKKKDFEESMIGLDTVMQLQPKLFRMLSDEDTAPKQLGFIAQDVKSVLPQAYVEQKDEDNTFIGLQDRPFIAALVKAIQEQQTLITQLTERITALEFK